MLANNKTPISVRRKRGRAQQEQKSQKTARQHNKRKLQDLRVHLKRRRVEGSESSLPEIIKERRRKASRLSGLETLPPELIELIFLNCLECNLAFASPYIGAILSREAIYRLLIRVAFFRPSAVHHDLFFYKHRPSLPIYLSKIADEEIGNLQHAILRTKWFTINRLMSVGDDIFRLYAQNQWFDRGVIMQPDDREKLDHWLDVGLRTYSGDVSERFQGKIGEMDYMLRFWIHDRDSQMDVSGSPDAQDSSPARSVSITFPYPILRFPDCRLRGPWTSEKVQFIKAMAPYTHVGQHSTRFTTSASALQDGIGCAIEENNVEALEILLTSYHKPKEIQPVFFLSAIHEPVGVELIKLLIRFCPFSLPHDDAEVTQFAMSVRDQGDPFGDWLLDYMLHLPGDIASDTPLFSHGRIMQYRNQRTEQALKVFGPLKEENPNRVDEIDELQEAIEDNRPAGPEMLA